MNIRLPIVWTICKKELSETLRDRRTLFLMLVLPVLLYPLLIMGFSRLAESESEASLAKPSRVAVWGRTPPALAQVLGSRPRLSIVDEVRPPAGMRVDGPFQPPALRPLEKSRTRSQDSDVPVEREELPNPIAEAARAAIGARQVDAVVVIWGDGESSSVYFDSVRSESSLAQARATRALDAYLQALSATAFQSVRRDVAPPSRQAGRIIGTTLPMMLLMLCVISGLYPAIDLTAGEKERDTMQTLMCAPVLPGEIIGGKFLAVWTLSLASAAANVVSLATTLTRSLSLDGAAIPISAYALTGLMLIPVTLLTSALFLAVAVFAKDYKEGQGLLTPVYMAVSLPAMVTMLPTIELNAWTAFVPVVSIALLIKSVLISEVRADLVFLALASSAVYGGLALMLAVRVFQREQVLLGGKESVREIFRFEPGVVRIPSPSLALVMFAAALVTSFYGSLLLESHGVIPTLLVTQYGFFLIPPIAAALLLRLDIRETFSLRLPRTVPLIASAILGVTAWTFASGILLRIAPPPESLVRALERLVRLTDHGAPLWVVWLVIAVTPALCEEALFRGFILRGLRRLGAVPAIGISALLFGIAHASIYRLLPTFFLGIVFGLIVWRTGSLLCSILAHALNNGVLATISESREVARFFGVQAGADALPWPATIGGTFFTLAALLLLIAASEGGMLVVRNRTRRENQVLPAAPTPG